MTAAQSVTPLAEQLGLKRGMRCWFHNMPAAVRDAIAPEAGGIEEQPTASDGLQCAHLFVPRQEKLKRELAALHPLMATNGFIWVSWPLEPDEGETDLSEDAVRSLADKHQLRPEQACTIGERWAAVKLSMRKEDR